MDIFYASVFRSVLRYFSFSIFWQKRVGQTPFLAHNSFFLPSELFIITPEEPEFPEAL